MPDQDHSPAFWTSVASAFRANPAVVFDLFNEPYDPTDPRSGSDQNPNDQVSWNCWQTGTGNGPAGGPACYTAAYDENANETVRYEVAGMQTLVNAVRATGAKQPVLVGGLDYANDLGDGDHGQQWLSHAPSDPLHQLAASFHNYVGKTCDASACWQEVIAPISAHVPVVTGEFDEDNYLESTCTSRTPLNFDAQYMTWADRAGVSYLAWGWMVESQSERDADGCGAFYLIDSSTYPPAPPNGIALHDHLRVLAATPPKPSVSTPPAVRLTTFAASVRPGSKKVRFSLRSPQAAAGTLTGRTVHVYASGRGTRHHVSLGTLRLRLSARRTHAVVVTLPRALRKLLVAKKSLRVQVTITLTSPHHRRTIVGHTITLRAAHR